MKMQVIDDTFEQLNDQNFIFYQGFLSRQAAEDYKFMLAEENIISKVEEVKNFGERVILGHINHFPFLLKVMNGDVSKIPLALRSSLDKQPSSYYDQHPLNSLTNEELMTMLKTAESESFEVQYTAIKILQLRGKIFEEKMIQNLLEKTNESNHRIKSVNTSSLVVIFLLMISGVFISWIVILICALILGEYSFGRSKDATGKKILTYDQSGRSSSKVVLVLGLMINVITLTYFYYNKPHIFLLFFNTPFLSNT